MLKKLLVLLLLVPTVTFACGQWGRGYGHYHGRSGYNHRGWGPRYGHWWNNSLRFHARVGLVDIYGHPIVIIGNPYMVCYQGPVTIYGYYVNATSDGLFLEVGPSQDTFIMNPVCDYE
jgi:hypothetical protein